MRLRGCLLFLSINLAAVAWGGVGIGHAQDSGGRTPLGVPDGLADSVELVDGTFQRGLIVEWDRKSHVSILLPSGTVERIAIDRVRGASRAGRPLLVEEGAPAAAPLREVDRILAGIPGPRVTLEASADAPAELQRRIGSEQSGSTVAYHIVCPLPCRYLLPVGDTQPYRIGAMRLQPTQWFSVPTSDAAVRVHMARAQWDIWPRAMLVGGLLFGVAGASFFSVHEWDGPQPWARTTGLVLGGIAGAFLISSVALWLFSPSTKYSITRK
jgi:hypothetical protein